MKKMTMKVKKKVKKSKKGGDEEEVDKVEASSV